MSIPRVFISYSHDSQSHKKWVLDLAVRLRNSGVDAMLDQWDLQPGDDIPQFMERSLASADRVLMICSENYVRKANLGSGGVGYEKMIVTSSLMKQIDSNKIVPIVRQAGTHEVPTFLKSKLFIDFCSEGDFEFSFDELIRALVGAPLFKKPPIGNNPFKSVAETTVERSADSVVELMKIVVSKFEDSTHPWVLYKDVLAASRVSRVLLDMAITGAMKKGLITLDASRDLVLTDAGKHYAVEHKIIR